MDTLRWTCPRCQAPNMPQSYACFRCHTHRPIAPDPTQQMDSRQVYARRGGNAVKAVALVAALFTALLLVSIGLGLLSNTATRQQYGVSTAPTPLGGPSTPAAPTTEPSAEVRWLAPGVGRITNTSAVPLTDVQVRTGGVSLTGQGGLATGMKPVVYVAVFAPPAPPAGATPLEQFSQPASVNAVTLQPGEGKGFSLPEAGAIFPADIDVRTKAGQRIEFTQVPPH